MTDTLNQDERIRKESCASVFLIYLAKVEKEGRSKEYMYQEIEWLNDFDERKLDKLIKGNALFEKFFQKIHLNPNAHPITGLTRVAGWIKSKIR